MNDLQLVATRTSSTGCLAIVDRIPITVSYSHSPLPQVSVDVTTTRRRSELSLSFRMLRMHDKIVKTMSILYIGYLLNPLFLSVIKIVELLKLPRNWLFRTNRNNQQRRCF